MLLCSPFFKILCVDLQTHTKISKKSELDTVAPDDAILAAVEPPPYGTGHVVGSSPFWPKRNLSLKMSSPLRISPFNFS